MDKLTLFQSYIGRCEETIASGETTDADKLQDEIIAVFESEISGIKSQLD